MPLLILDLLRNLLLLCLLINLGKVLLEEVFFASSSERSLPGLWNAPTCTVLSTSRIVRFRLIMSPPSTPSLRSSRSFSVFLESPSSLFLFMSSWLLCSLLWWLLSEVSSLQQLRERMVRRTLLRRFLDMVVWWIALTACSLCYISPVFTIIHLLERRKWQWVKSYDWLPSLLRPINQGYWIPWQVSCKPDKCDSWTVLFKQTIKLWPSKVNGKHSELSFWNPSKGVEKRMLLLFGEIIRLNKLDSFEFVPGGIFSRSSLTDRSLNTGECGKKEVFMMEFSLDSGTLNDVGIWLSCVWLIWLLWFPWFGWSMFSRSWSSQPFVLKVWM